MITIKAKGRGIEAIAEHLRRIRQNAKPDISAVLRDTARKVHIQFAKRAPVGRTRELFQSARFTALPRGGAVSIAARHGKASEARNPAFNRSIRSGMKGIRTRIREALREA